MTWALARPLMREAFVVDHKAQPDAMQAVLFDQQRFKALALKRL